MTDKKMVAIGDADYTSLKHHASTILGLDIKSGTNSNGLRAKIATVAPHTTEIEQIGSNEPGAVTEVAVPAPAAIATGKPKYSAGSPTSDPKVKLIIRKTDDPTRDKNVTVSVNGAVWRMMRGQPIDVPYRVYCALNDAVEKRAILMEEEGSFGLPKYEYQEVNSYPFEVLSMPSDEEIAAWQLATCEHSLAAAA